MIWPPLPDHLQGLVSGGPRQPTSEFLWIAEPIEALKCGKAYTLKHVLRFLGVAPRPSRYCLDDRSIFHPQLGPRLLIPLEAGSYQRAVVQSRRCGVRHFLRHRIVLTNRLSSAFSNIRDSRAGREIDHSDITRRGEYACRLRL